MFFFLLPNKDMNTQKQCYVGWLVGGGWMERGNIRIKVRQKLFPFTPQSTKMALLDPTSTLKLVCHQLKQGLPFLGHHHHAPPT
jgi:hypothetical protein